MGELSCNLAPPPPSWVAVEITPAILLRKTKLTETSLIVSWLTESSGRIKTVAKGARNPRSRFAGVLDLFFQCEIHFSHSRQGDLHQLREAVVLESHEQLRYDYVRTMLAGYFVELIELVTEPEHPVPELHDLLRRGLAYLNATAGTLKAMVHFESELTRLLGIQQPGLSAAVALGRAYHKLPSGRKGLVDRLG